MQTLINIVPLFRHGTKIIPFTGTITVRPLHSTSMEWWKYQKYCVREWHMTRMKRFYGALNMVHSSEFVDIFEDSFFCAQSSKWVRRQGWQECVASTTTGCSLKEWSRKLQQRGFGPVSPDYSSPIACLSCTTPQGTLKPDIFVWRIGFLNFKSCSQCSSSRELSTWGFVS